MAQTNNTNNNNFPNMPPFDPFMHFLWGPPPGSQMMPPMQAPNTQSNQQNQQQSTQDPAPGAMPPFDFDKLMSGADQMFKLVNQIQPMVKQLGPLFNMFKK